MARSYLLAILPLLSKCYAAMAPGAWSMGPTSEGIVVIEAHATVDLPATPEPVTGYSAIWFGLGTKNSDLYQSIASNGPPDFDKCNGQTWCANAFVLHTSGDPSQGPIANLGPHTRMTWHYVKEGDSMRTTVEVNGKTVSEVVTSYANPIGAGTSVECHTHPAGEIQGHTWTDISVVLSAPDPNLKKTHTTGCFSSDDNVTWKCSNWKIASWNCDKI